MGMRLDEWRAMLQVDDRKSASDEDFWAICPCHSDHDASLHVRIGPDGGIQMKCFSCGVGSVDVAKAMGRTAADVMCDARTGEDFGRGKGSAPRKKREGKAPKPAERGWEVGKTWKLGKKGEETPYKLTQLYDYKLRDGTVKMQKARLEYVTEEGEKKKSFAFRHIGTDGRWYTGTGIYGGLLYGLEQLNEAKRDGKTVYIVEGEKDAGNLQSCGYVAVSSAYGGGSSAKLEGKWLSDYTQALEDVRRVVVIPDNDAAGEGIARYICKQLTGKAGEVRILWLADSLTGEDAEKFAKGDFTDWYKLRHDAGKKRPEILAEFEQLAEKAAVYEEGMARRFESRMSVSEFARQTAQELSGDDDGSDEDNGEPYYGMKNYSIKWQKLCKVDKSGASILCDFVPIPKETVIHDDGVERTVEYVIGATYKGRELEDAHVSPEAMGAMRWPEAAWPYMGNIRPTKGARDYVRDAIMRAGQTMGVGMRTIYGHTGMREIDGKMCYLYNGGAIGAIGASVELKNNARYYTMETPASEKEGAAALEMLASCFPARIILPLLAQAFLAPVYSLLEEMEEPPSYAVYVVGRTNSYKSTLVGYVESMFGKFYLRRHTATFQDTMASVRKSAFVAKDALFVVDDYNPETDAARRRSMDALAQAVITSIADRAGRNGLDARHNQRDAEPARCTCIMTGEQLPGLNAGRVTRLYVIDVAPGEIAGDVEFLATFQKAEKGGVYRAAMRGYIERLLARWGGMEDELRERLDNAELLVLGDKSIPRSYARLLDAGKHLMVGCGLMIDYLIQAGQIEADMRDAWMDTSWEAIRENILAQGALIGETNPVTIYMGAIRSLVRMRAVRVEEISDAEDSRGFLGPDMVGYKDDNFYYFDPTAIDRAVRKLLKDRGEDMGQNAATIRKMLLEQQVCFGDKNNPCKVKTIRGRQQRMLWIPRGSIDGKTAEQIRAETAEFTEIPKNEQTKLPFD